MSESTFGQHLRAACAAAFLLALGHVVIETAVMAVIFRAVIIEPGALIPARWYDFFLKLYMAIPGAAHLLHGGPLDRFLPAGAAGKLSIAVGAAVPNLVMAVVCALLVAGICAALRRPARLTTALGALVTLGCVVHAVSFARGVHFREDPTLWEIGRNSARAFVRDGTLIALVTLALAAAVAFALSRLQPRLRLAVSLATAGAMSVAVVVIGVSNPSLSGAGVHATAIGTTERSAPPVDAVVLISIDSLRADHLGAYGYPKATSPNLDRLAAEGTRFSYAISSTSWTLPAHMSVMTGRHLLSHGVIADTDRLPESVPTLAERLQVKGFATGGIVSMLFLGSPYGFARGFDSYDDETIPAKTPVQAYSDEPAPVVTALATKWLEQHRRDRFFLFLHYWDVHYDYIPPAPYDTMFDPDYRGAITGEKFYFNKAVRAGMPQRDLDHLIALYDGEIRWVDEHIGALLRSLDELGLAQRTAVIVFADHGDEFFEHGFKGHRRTLYDEVLHVPLLMRVPGMPPGRVVETASSLVDVMPTILDLTGEPSPAGVEGISLVPAMLGGSLPERGALHAEFYWPEHSNSLVLQRSAAGTTIHKFQPHVVESYPAGDYGQHSNRAGGDAWPRRQELDTLAQWLNGGWDVYRGFGNAHRSVALDKATSERLRALGY